ncbi:MAG: MFS transporter [Actinobacteria bacterium]|nr:MAG: MFS transporter [Actinomycetota bacterium]
MRCSRGAGAGKARRGVQGRFCVCVRESKPAPIGARDVGGKGAVGLVFALRLIPAALLAPFAGLLADRYPRQLVLLASTLARVALMVAAAACVFLDAPPAAVYALAVAAAIATVPFRSTQAALTPSLARTPSELTAANAVASTIESLAIFVGPMLAGLVLSLASTGVVFTLNAALVAVAAMFVVRLRVPPAERKPELEAGTIVAEAAAGFRAIGRDSSLRVLIGLFSAQTFVAGALQVYIVVLAFESLGQGDSGVGFLNSAMGVGALLGGVVALSLTGSSRLSLPFAVGVLGWGVPLILLGSHPGLAVAPLVQRAVADEVLARVFGVIQMLWWLALAFGALVAPALVGWLGIRTALVATGSALVVLVALLWRPLRAIDARAVAPEATELRILASVPIFAPLPGMSLEHLAGRLVPLRVDSGTVIVRQGDEGDRFYMLVEGKVEVSEDGKPISSLDAGGYFGEIALLRDLPRTATVTASTPVVLYALDRDDFLAAVTGHAPSAQAAEDVVSARLAGLPTPEIPLSSA